MPLTTSPYEIEPQWKVSDPRVDYLFLEIWFSCLFAPLPPPKKKNETRDTFRGSVLYCVM